MHVIFDDQCLMCNYFIHVLDKFSAHPVYVYGSWSSFSVSEPYLAEKFSFYDSICDSSIVLITGGLQVFTRSAAVLKCFAMSKYMLIRLLARVLFIFPSPLLDPLYIAISSNRLLVSKLFPSRCTFNFSNLILK